MQPYEDSRPAPTPKLKVVPPSQLKPIEESVPPPLTPKALDNNGKKRHHTLIMVGTIVAALVGISLIELADNINGNGKVEPDSNEEENIALPAGHFLERLHQKSQFRKGETVATTIDLQQEDKLREIKQTITDANAQKNNAEKELEVARRQLQEAEVNLNVAENNATKSRKNIDSTANLTLVDREIEVKLRERDNLRYELQQQQGFRNVWQGLIEEGAMGVLSSQVMNTDSEIRRLTSQLSIVEGQILQAESKRVVTKDQLIDKNQEDSDRSQKEILAVSTSKEKFNQAIQRVRDSEDRLKQLLTREKELLAAQEKQTTHLAPFDGVADFTDIKKYRNQRLAEPVKIRFYNPENMMVRIKVTQLDYCRVKEGMDVSFTPYGKKEIMGKVELKAIRGDSEPGNPNAVLFSVWVRVNSSDGNQKVTLDNDMIGKTSIKIGSERIYKIVGGEIYKLFNPLQSSFSYCE